MAEPVGSSLFADALLLRLLSRLVARPLPHEAHTHTGQDAQTRTRQDPRTFGTECFPPASLAGSTNIRSLSSRSRLRATSAMKETLYRQSSP